jgi:diguanylate cyclase (GGDEF)-like protein/PAS domain S-box-containing protein
MSVQPPAERVEFEARLLGAIGQPVVATDVEFRVVYWNRGAELLLGFPASEMLGRDLIEGVSIEVTDDRLDRLLADLENGLEIIDEFLVHKRDGSPVPVLVLVTPILDDDARLVGIVLVGTDVTERKASEATMARLSAIVESSSDAIIGMDLTGLVTSWNAGAEQLFGQTTEAMLGRSVASLTASGSGADVAAMLKGLVGGDTVHMVELVGARGDGSPVAIESTVYPVSSREGTVIGAAAISRDVTARRALERIAEDEHRRLEEAQRVAQVGSFEFDFVSLESKWSRELRRLMGVGPDEPPDYTAFLERIHPDDYEQFRRDIEAWLAGSGQFFECEFRVIPEPDVERWLSARVEVFRDGAGAARTMVASVRDVTEQKANTRARRRAEEQFLAAFDLGGVGMLVTDLDRRILRANAAFCQLIGLPLEEVLGSTPDDFADPAEPYEQGSLVTDRTVSSGGDRLDIERRYLRSDGTTVYTELHVSVLRNEKGEPEYLFFQVVDVTGRKRVEDELQSLAMHDPLTGLPNRYLLQDRLETALARAQRSHQLVAVLFIDVDHFKLVNDSLGHSTGDTLLVQLASRLMQESRSGDTVARFGGDEFAMVCEDVSDVAEAERIGQRVLALFDEPFLIAEQQLYVTVSTGIVVATPGATPITVLRDADAAMYQAKDRGRARAEMFDESLRHQAAKRLDVEMMLRHALERGEFRVVYQPVVSLPGDMPVSVEALLRWEHPERGTLSPTEFIPTAEETGLIVPIGAWVLEEALAQLSKWRRQLAGASSLYVAVNLSPRQLLSGDLLARCRDATAGNHIPADALCLEITEGAVMQDVDVSVPILRKIADSGIRIAVDDFGSGYSSLSYLKRLPVGTLKIDRSFVNGLPHDADDSAIVRAIVSLGYALGLELCAEGVETPAQRAELVGLGCHLGQGYLWAPAMRPDAFAEWYRRRVTTVPGPAFAPE